MKQYGHIRGRLKQHWHLRDVGDGEKTLKGVYFTLKELDDLCDQLADGPVEIVAQCTDRVHRETVARWNASAGMSEANARGRRGLRLAHRTQRYREAIRKIFFDDGLTGKVYVRHPIEGPRGKRARDLPLWLEYGTRKMQAREHMQPAFELGVRMFDRLMARFMSSLGR